MSDQQSDQHGIPSYDLKSLLKRFLTDTPDIENPLADVVGAFGLERLESFDEVESLLPVGNVPSAFIDGCYTDLDDAPFLFATRAGVNFVLAEGENPQETMIGLTRRCAMLNTQERDIFEWLSDLSGVDPVRTDEEAGNHSWTYKLKPKAPMTADHYRLFVAKAEGMLVVDRISVYNP